jgi:threonine/homoserine/homoserine lactone efflux protein
MPGPFQAYLLDQTLSRGTRRTLPFSLAPLVAEVPIVSVILLAVSKLPGWTLSALHIAGGLLLFYLAAESYRAVRGEPGGGEHPGGGGGPDARGLPSQRAGFARAVAMNFLSPGPYLFWSLLAGPVVVEAAASSAVEAAGFAAGYYALLIGGFAGFVVLFGMAARLGRRTVRVLRLITAAGLLGFGIYQVVRGAAGLL